MRGHGVFVPMARRVKLARTWMRGHVRVSEDEARSVFNVLAVFALDALFGVSAVEANDIVHIKSKAIVLYGAENMHGENLWLSHFASLVLMPRKGVGSSVSRLSRSLRMRSRRCPVLLARSVIRMALPIRAAGLSPARRLVRNFRASTAPCYVYPAQVAALAFIDLPNVVLLGGWLSAYVHCFTLTVPSGAKGVW